MIQILLRYCYWRPVDELCRQSSSGSAKLCTTSPKPAHPSNSKSGAKSRRASRFHHHHDGMRSVVVHTSYVHLMSLLHVARNDRRQCRTTSPKHGTHPHDPNATGGGFAGAESFSHLTERYWIGHSDGRPFGAPLRVLLQPPLSNNKRRKENDALFTLRPQSSGGGGGSRGVSPALTPRLNNNNSRPTSAQPTGSALWKGVTHPIEEGIALRQLQTVAVDAWNAPDVRWGSAATRMAERGFTTT